MAKPDPHIARPAGLPDSTQLEIRQHQSRYYAILKQDDETLGVTASFPTHTAAFLAGQSLLERYRQNLESGKFC